MLYKTPIHVLVCKEGRKTQILLLNFQPRIMHFQHSDWFTQSRFLAQIPQLDLIWKTTKFLSEKAVKQISRAFYRLINRKKKNRKCHTGSDRKATNFGLKLFNGTPKFPYKFIKEIISSILPYVELSNNNNKVYLKKFFESLASPCGTRLSKPSADFLRT